MGSASPRIRDENSKNVGVATIQKPISWENLGVNFTKVIPPEVEQQKPPEKLPSNPIGKETSLPTIHFQGRSVSFSEG